MKMVNMTAIDISSHFTLNCFNTWMCRRDIIICFYYANKMDCINILIVDRKWACFTAQLFVPPSPM